MIYTPIKPSAKPELSFGVEIKTHQASDSEDHLNRSILNDITEVEYQITKKKTTQSI